MVKFPNIQKVTQIIRKANIRKRFKAAKVKQHRETSYQCLKIIGVYEIVKTLREIENAFSKNMIDVKRAIESKVYNEKFTVIDSFNNGLYKGNYI